MANQTLAIVGVVFIVVLCVVSYAPLADRLAQDDVQSLSYGSMLSTLLPLLLTMFAIVFSIVAMVVASSGGFASK